MAETIIQKVVFKNTTPKIIYDLYMNAKKHTLATGGAAKISNKAGAPYSAYNGYINGKNLHLDQDSLIVQSWRASDWDATDADSVLMLNLKKKGKDTVVHMVHANVPDKHYDGLHKGWHDFYWTPWKKHLSTKPKKNKSRS